jgi:hypothetical protein
MDETLRNEYIAEAKFPVDCNILTWCVPGVVFNSYHAQFRFAFATVYKEETYASS